MATPSDERDATAGEGPQTGALGNAEFQALILAGGPGSGLYPLTQSSPKVLLPLANHPMLYYQLMALEKAGFAEVIVACTKQQEEDIARYVSQTYSGQIRVDLVGLSEPDGDAPEAEAGTAQVLRRVRDKITKDVFVVSGDVVTMASLLDLADLHRTNDAAVTMLLKQHPNVQLKEQRSKLRKMNKQVVNYFGIVPEGTSSKGKTHGRVVLMKSAAQEDPVGVTKQLLRREPGVRLHSDLFDAHIYVLRRWVLELLCSDGEDIASRRASSMATLRTDFFPFVINQLQPNAANPEVRALTARLIDRTGFSASTTPSDLADTSEYTVGRTAAQRSAEKITCQALVLPATSVTFRANTLYSYALANHALANLPRGAPTPWPRPRAAPKFKETIIGESSEIDETASIRNCVIGAHCKIGAGVEISNTVIMDHCTIEANVSILNSILGEQSFVPEGCSLTEIQLQHGCSISPPGLVLKSQAYTKIDFS
ncbi:Mannose-1-phosphate guanyltransferase [Hondaea fermentalgiana]|uniref:Translation initiation factor eIF2B subunit gamma n=1 Tax=Hondaea fermentalgiana TaxID=2315210 RepID=A0A2R5FZH4_9STRA|nr:Mannose-1-phosphate guanyltransferase [Hondaea fermentalgiana]|eukprot:GBG24157.1 Mannose-1-phosphate guanyltransferase [Hondaea fermentalgiana]